MVADLAILSKLTNVEAREATLADTIYAMGQRVTQWFLFGVVVGVIPPILNGVLELLTSRSLNFSVLWDLSVLFGRGELLMLSVGLSSATIGDAIVAKGFGAALRTTAVGVSFIMSLVAVAAYAIVITLQKINSEILGDAVAVVSLIP